MQPVLPEGFSLHGVHTVYALQVMRTRQRKPGSALPTKVSRLRTRSPLNRVFPTPCSSPRPSQDPKALPSPDSCVSLPGEGHGVSPSPFTGGGTKAPPPQASLPQAPEQLCDRASAEPRLSLPVPALHKPAHPLCKEKHGVGVF